MFNFLLLFFDTCSIIMITLKSGKAGFILILNHQFGDEGWWENPGEKVHPRFHFSSVSHSCRYHLQFLVVEVQRSHFASHLTSDGCSPPQNLCSLRLPPSMQRPKGLLSWNQVTLILSCWVAGLLACLEDLARMLRILVEVGLIICWFQRKHSFRALSRAKEESGTRFCRAKNLFGAWSSQSAADVKALKLDESSVGIWSEN